MKKIVFFIAVLAIISCKEEPKVDYAILSGKIVNSSIKELSFNSAGSLIKSIKVDERHPKLPLSHVKRPWYIEIRDPLILLKYAIDLLCIDNRAKIYVLTIDIIILRYKFECILANHLN